MNKKSIFIILFVMAISACIVSIYSTFAYDEEATTLEDSTADYNLLYSIKENSENKTSVLAGETKMIDVNLKNEYASTVKYGMYYYLLSPKELPNNVTITLADESLNLLEDVINEGEEKVITIKIKNLSEENIEIVIGALVGFENGNIKELIKDGEILIR